ncbi:MAG TPA: SDR family NAD(P)-dependent oxidoreductase [Steroidobacteraceae bacterium]|nr:SDR family NAD(P)-dependent oxidoreductase [Steroidobacteraceae bacterium]
MPQPTDYSGKIAFITGGASGVGFGQATVFAEAGCRIVIADIRRNAIDEALAKLRAQGAEAHGIELDVTDRAAYARAADEVERVFGKAPELLFNTAGINAFGPVEKSTYDDFDWLVGVNFGGVVNGLVTFVPRMIAANRGGHIVTTSSMGGFAGNTAASIYSAAKAAVINLMESYRLALASYNIRVSVLCPANVRSNIAEATRLRPAHLANSGYVVNEEVIQALRSIHAHGMDPVVLARRTKEAMEADQLYIIPYPEEKERLAAHFRQIVDSVLPMEADPQGARERLEALQNWAKDRQRLMSKGKND